jgi:trk system potassium uptake protein TrkA
MGAHEVTWVVPEGGPARADRLDVELVRGLPGSTATLRRAGVGSTDLFVGCTSRDEENLVACANARRLGAQRTVCFLFRQDLDAEEDDEASVAELLGVDVVVRPVRQLAEEILRIATVPGALDVEAFVGGRVHLLRHAIEAGAPITRGPLKDVGVPEGTVFVMARREGAMFLPKGDTHFRPGDQLTVMGTMAGIDRLLHEGLRPADRGTLPRRATIVGGGNVGFAVAQGLEQAGWRVRVIESDRARCEEISAQMSGLVLHGDGTDLDLLEAERVGEDSVLVAVTSNDEKNLLVSLLAKQQGVPRIVTRADTHANERLFERVGVDVVRSARGAAVQAVMRGIGEGRRELLAELEHGDAEVLELTLPEELQPVPLAQMKGGAFAIIGAILRGGRVIIPKGSDAVQGRDRILVFCPKHAEDDVRDFFLRRILRPPGA